MLVKMPCESARDLFRHTLATLAYRGGNAFRGLPDAFSDFRVAPGSRSAGEILAHIGDLLDWALITAREKNVWRESTPQEWDRDVERFFTAVTALDDYLASDAPLHAPLDKLLQGPIADALTHVGQIAMMRRLAAAPMKFENYFRADVLVGRSSLKETLTSVVLHRAKAS
jgi:hypothetical protein